MKIFRTALVMDGGSVLIESDKGPLFIDNRTETTTRGKIFVGFPQPNNVNYIPEQYQEVVKQDILKAEFMEHRNGFEHIESLLKLTDKQPEPIVEKKDEAVEIPKKE